MRQGTEPVLQHDLSVLDPAQFCLRPAGTVVQAVSDLLKSGEHLDNVHRALGEAQKMTEGKVSTYKTSVDKFYAIQNLLRRFMKVYAGEQVGGSFL